MSISLNIKERFLLMQAIGNLPCNLLLRYSVDPFLKQLEFTIDEIKDKEIKVNNNMIDCNDLNYVITIDNPPNPVINSIKDWINNYDVDSFKNNELIQSYLNIFKKIIEN